MRRFCAFLVLAMFATAFTQVAGATTQSIPSGRVLEFEAYRNGSPIGRHRLTFRPEGERVSVEVAIRLKVDLAFLTLYRYEHDSRELWNQGRLVGLATRTNDDGKKTEVRARAEGDQLTIEGSGGAFSLPLGSFPTSYWDPKFTAQTTVLDTQDGVRTMVRAAPPVRETFPVLGKPVPADRYSLSGELTMDLWYTPKGEWVGLKFTSKGSEITYARLTPLDE